MQATDDLIEAREVATMLKVTVSWVRDHCTRVQPILPQVKLGRKVRFERLEILRFIRLHREERPMWDRNKKGKAA